MRSSQSMVNEEIPDKGVFVNRWHILLLLLPTKSMYSFLKLFFWASCNMFSWNLDLTAEVGYAEFCCSIVNVWTSLKYELPVSVVWNVRLSVYTFRLYLYLAELKLFYSWTSSIHSILLTYWEVQVAAILVWLFCVKSRHGLLRRLQSKSQSTLCLNFNFHVTVGLSALLSHCWRAKR